MRRVEAVAAVVMATSLAGCVLPGKPKVAKAPATVVEVPPPPPPAPPPVPLSIPQTHAELPPPQPLSAEAVATTEPPEEPPATTTPAPRPVRRPSSQARSEPPPMPVGPTQPVEPERAPIQEIVPAEEQKRFQDEASAIKRDLRQRLDSLKGRQLSRQEHNLVNRISSFVKLSDDAERRGDMRTAYELADRGRVLAKDLAGGK